MSDLIAVVRIVNTRDAPSVDVSDWPPRAKIREAVAEVMERIKGPAADRISFLYDIDVEFSPPRQDPPKGAEILVCLVHPSSARPSRYKVRYSGGFKGSWTSMFTAREPISYVWSLELKPVVSFVELKEQLTGAVVAERTAVPTRPPSVCSGALFASGQFVGVVYDDRLERAAARWLDSPDPCIREAGLRHLARQGSARQWLRGKFSNDPFCVWMPDGARIPAIAKAFIFPSPVPPPGWGRWAARFHPLRSIAAAPLTQVEDKPIYIPDLSPRASDFHPRCDYTPLNVFWLALAPVAFAILPCIRPARRAMRLIGFSGISALLALIVIGGWLRSLWHADELICTAGRTRIEVVSYRGGLQFLAAVQWSQRDPLQYGTAGIATNLPWALFTQSMCGRYGPTVYDLITDDALPRGTTPWDWAALARPPRHTFGFAADYLSERDIRWSDSRYYAGIATHGYRFIQIPYWSMLVLSLILPALRLRRLIRARLRLRRNLCPTCGYDLRERRPLPRMRVETPRVDWACAPLPTTRPPAMGKLHR